MNATWTTPGERWRLLAPATAVVVEIPSRPLAVRNAAARVRALPVGSAVVLLDHRRGSLRARRIAASAGVAVDREYVALPSLRSAIVLAEDSANALRWACQSLVAPPPAVTWAHGPVSGVITLLRRYPRLASRLAAGRVLVGRTS